MGTVLALPHYRKWARGEEEEEEEDSGVARRRLSWSPRADGQELHAYGTIPLVLEVYRETLSVLYFNDITARIFDIPSM